MNRFITKLFLTLFLGSILFFGVLAKETNAAGCTATINFLPITNPAPYNQSLSANVKITLSGFDNGGSNDGYCSYNSLLTSFTYKTIYAYFDFDSPVNLTVFPPAPISGNRFSVDRLDLEKNSPTINYEDRTINPSKYGFKGGDTMTIRVYVLACNTDALIKTCVILTGSSPQNVKLNTGAFANYACTGPNSSGQTVYICDTKNTSNCENTIGCTSKQPCTSLSDSNMCGKVVSNTATHKACQNNTCKIVPGAGSDTCTISPNSCAGGGGTTQNVFNLPNPIGVENFQDLINIFRLSSAGIHR